MRAYRFHKAMKKKDQMQPRFFYKIGLETLVKRWPVLPRIRAIQLDFVTQDVIEAVKQFSESFFSFYAVFSKNASLSIEK